MHHVVNPHASSSDILRVQLNDFVIRPFLMFFDSSRISVTPLLQPIFLTRYNFLIFLSYCTTVLHMLLQCLQPCLNVGAVKLQRMHNTHLFLSLFELLKENKKCSTMGSRMWEVSIKKKKKKKAKTYAFLSFFPLAC